MNFARELEFVRAIDIKDGARLRKFMEWADKGLCPHLVFNDNGWWAVSFEGIGPVSMNEPPSDGQFHVNVEAGQWRRTVREAIDAATETLAKEAEHE